MKTLHITALAALTVLTACAHQQQDGVDMPVTPIAKLSLPTPSAVSGIITKKNADSFVVKDASGSLLIDPDYKKVMKLLKVGEKVAVIGVVDEDDSIGKPAPVVKEMDAYLIIKADGTNINLVPYNFTGNK